MTPKRTGLSGWLPPLHIARRLARWMAVALTYTAAVALVVYLLKLPTWAAGNEAAATLGVVLGTLLVFHNNTANDRWWEARKLWGQLINESRNLALKAHAHAAVEPGEHRQLARLLAGFAHALRLHLRGVGGVQAVPGFEQEPTSFPHAPGYVAGLVHQLLDRWNRQGKLHDALWLLDVHARALMDVCGACERIRNTPLASSYRSLLRGGIALYALLAPWSLSLEMGWWSVPVLTLGFGFLLGMELTADEVEEPFGTEEDDLPMEAYCRAVETFVRDALEDAPARRGG